MRKLLLIVLILFITTSVCQSQYHNLKITTIRDQSGQQPSATFDIVEDNLGFIWFGTVDGLYRYDGYNYKIYRNDQNNPYSLAWNTIRALTLTSDNKLWIGTQGGGLDCFDLTEEKFTHYPFNKDVENGISGNDIWALMTDRNDNIWVGVVGHGVDMLDRKTNSIIHYEVLPSSEYIEGLITIQSIFEDSDGTVWIGMNSYGLSAINPKTGDIKNYRHNPNNPNSLSSNDVYDIFEDSERNLVICTYSGGINIYDKETGIFKKIRRSENNNNSLVSNLVRTGIEIRPQVFWVGTEYGVSIYNAKENSFSNHQYRKNIPNSLSDNRIRVVMKDRKGIVWIGSEAGVDKVTELRNFKTFQNNPSDPNSFPEGIVRSIFEDNKGNLWFGIIDQGLVRYNPKTKMFKRFLPNPLSKGSISGIHITSIFQDSNGVLWIGEWDTGINKFNPKTETFELVASTQKTKVEILDTRIQFIREAKPGFLWIGSEGGLSLYNSINQSIKHFTKDPQNSNSLSGNGVQSNAFTQDNAGNLWVGTWSEGLNRIEFTDSSFSQANFTNWRYNPNNPEGINNNNIISLHLSGQKLWIGTFGGGLNLLDLTTGKFKHYISVDGLPNNIIFSILEDDEKNLWLSTDKGLSRFNPVTEEFQNFDKSDGLQDDHFFWGASFKSKSGEIFFGGINGANSFYLSDLKFNKNIPPLFLTDVKVNNQSLSFDKSTTLINRLEFSHKVNSFQIDFTSLDYSEPLKNQYAYKLTGGDGSWISNGNRNHISFMNIAPGDYKLSIKGSNNDGLWNEEGLTIDLIIVPPYWQTWWFRIIVGLMLLSIITGFYTFRNYQIKQQKRELEQLVKIRTEELEAINEELRAINEELYNQREELSSTLLKLRIAQNQLVQSEKMASLGLLAAGVAHEINNPLNFIQGGINAIENYVMENLRNHLPSISSLLEMVKVGVIRISGIVGSLNHYSRKDDSKSVTCNIHTIIDNCLLMLNYKMKNRIKIQKEYYPKPIPIFCNEGKMHQAILNILTNAFDSIEGEGEISIRTDLHKSNILIVINDSGCGIDPESLMKITDPFYTTKDPGKGTGLGLSITQNIIEEHKGSMEFNSEVGKGTRVTISIPQAQ